MAANTELIFGKISKAKKIPNRKSKASLAIGISQCMVRNWEKKEIYMTRVAKK